MILPEAEVKERYESPLNLLNRLKSQLSSPHSKKSNLIVSIPPTSSEVIDNLDEKLSSGGLKSKAAAIMSTCLDELKSRVREIEKPERLASIAAEMNKVVTAENKNNDRDSSDKPQIIVYAPSIISEEHFETVYVKE